jgi:hypothetical protein
MITGEKIELPKGTIEHLIVQVKDRLNNVTDLSLLTPLFDVRKRGASSYIVQGAVPTILDMTLYCLVDTTVADYVSGTYELFVYFDNTPELPRLGPFEFEVNA